MGERNTYWIQQAHKYASEHPAVAEAGPIVDSGNGVHLFRAIFRVNLPGKCGRDRVTDLGVRDREPVEFVFPPHFPYGRPQIILRDDFNRNLPHINPSKKRVYPCVYYGDLADLLQQPKWFDHVLDQVADWLEKAAANDLMNYRQGWEPMRMDQSDGIVFYDIADLRRCCESRVHSEVSALCLKLGECICAGGIGVPSPDTRHNTRAFLFCPPPDSVSDKYIPVHIETFSDLHEYALQQGVAAFKETIDRRINDLEQQGRKLFLVFIGVRRPMRLIGQTSNIEVLNFAIETKIKKKNRRLDMSARVYHLTQYDICTPGLLSRYSGVDHGRMEPIVQIGCGSLGSKIAMHLARNGNEGFMLIDPDHFAPHNNARHACALVTGRLSANKAELVAEHIRTMNLRVEARPTSVMECPEVLQRGGVIIDSTANLAIGNYLAQTLVKGRLIQTALYAHGKMGILTVEGANRNPRIDDLMCRLYSQGLSSDHLHNSLFREQRTLLSLGQGCGSYSVQATDSRISLVAAGMAAYTQKLMSTEFPKAGAVYVGDVDSNDMGVKWSALDVGPTVVVTAPDSDNWEVRLLHHVVEEMSRRSSESDGNETGGVLVGRISMPLRCLTVTNLLPPPEDSIMTPTLFQLGTKGLRAEVEGILDKTNGVLTYLGTWHSHPRGGGASATDSGTKARLLVLRDYEPTVCLIWTPGGIIRV